MTVLVYVATDETGVAETSLEAVAFARTVPAGETDAAGETDSAREPDPGGMTPNAAVAGPMPDDIDAVLARHGVGEVHHLTGTAFDTYSPAAIATGLRQLCESVDPELVVTGGSPRENEVMAHLAARLERPMAANVLALVDRQPLTVTRQMAGGAAVEDMSLPARPALVTVAGHAMAADPAPTPTQPAWHQADCEVPAADLAARVTSVAPAAADNTSALKNARVVIGAGRGAGGPGGFDDVTRLAEMLGGAVGISRVAADLGWHPADEQVGQTGSRISPELYMPCGISGAIQHWAGCSSAKTILAINVDPDAPMVAKADYAVIGDMHRILPAVIDELARRRSA